MTHQFEKEIKKALKKEFKEDAEQYWSHYVGCKIFLEREVFPYIVGTEPSLSDHTLKHIQNVQHNAHNILDGHYSEFSGTELYILALIILFHDVGNVFGRESHNKYDVIARVYDEHLKDNSAYTNERRLVITAAEAHSGKSATGSRDTLSEIAERDNLNGRLVRLRELAAILRFADELAEGPQRTSDFMVNNNRFSNESLIFHEYAKITNIFIDKGTERIALTYIIKLKLEDGTLNKEKEIYLRDLLNFTYKRISKINQERRYARYHSKYCNIFKKTAIVINIEVNGRQAINIKECTLNDNVIPGQDTLENIEKKFNDFKIDKIIKKLNQR